MGNQKPTGKTASKRIKRGRRNTNPIRRRRETVFYWYDKLLRDHELVPANAAPPISTAKYEEAYAQKGVAASASALLTAERIFYLPTLDATTPIAEGPPPADWHGYHSGKHGVWERFQNVKGEQVNMGELFYNERYRWVTEEFREGPNKLKYVTEAEFKKWLNKAYEDAPKRTLNMRGWFESDKFTKDIAKIFKQRGNQPSSTIWQGRYMYRDGTLGNLQTNVDFRFKGHNWRVAIDAKTGRVLNMFRIDPNPKFGPMRFAEIVVKWKGAITEVETHKAPNSTITVEISATWRGLFLQGLKTGALASGLVAGFLGAISGFKKEGIPGALKGLAIGALVGGAIGGTVGGVVALLNRIWPWVGRVANVVGFVTIVIAIVFDSSETSLDPPEFGGNTKKDKDGNVWGYRNIKKEGTWFPKYTPRGVRIWCTDKTVLDFGHETGWQSSYRRTPITVFSTQKYIKWLSVRTPEGSTMWWWQEQKTKEEHILVFEDNAAMDYALKRYVEESSFRFVPTKN